MTVKPPSLPPIPPTLAACAWLGWVRCQGQPWRPMVGGATQDECLTQLVNLVVGRSCDKIVTQQGKRP